MFDYNILSNKCIQVSETDLATPVDPPATSQGGLDILISLPEHPTNGDSSLSSQQLEVIQASKAILDTVRMRDFHAYK